MTEHSRLKELWIEELYKVLPDYVKHMEKEVIETAASSLADSDSTPEEMMEETGDENEYLQFLASVLMEADSEWDEESKRIREEEIHDLIDDVAEAIASALDIPEKYTKFSYSSAYVYLDEYTFIRVSDHDQRPTYENMYGTPVADVAVGSKRPTATHVVLTPEDIPRVVEQLVEEFQEDDDEEFDEDEE